MLTGGLYSLNPFKIQFLLTAKTTGTLYSTLFSYLKLTGDKHPVYISAISQGPSSFSVALVHKSYKNIQINSNRLLVT